MTPPSSPILAGDRAANPALRDSRSNAVRPGFLQLILPFWRSEQRYAAFSLLGVLLVLIFGTTFLHVWTNKLAGQVIDALVNRQWDALQTALTLSVLVGISAGSVPFVRQAISDVLDIRWRTWMTDHLLNDWLQQNRFFSVERDGLLSNVDQRISDDVRIFTDQSLNMFLSLVSVVFNVITFSALVWGLSRSVSFDLAGQTFTVKGYMLYIAFAYAFGGLAITHWVGKVMIGLNMHRQTVEADYRFRAMQVRENAEQIAFYRGGDEEQKSLMERFGAIRRNFLATIVRRLKIGLTTTVYDKFFGPLPTVAALPLYFTGQITIGGITRVSGAFSALVSHLSWFSQAYVGITDWLAVANRLRDLAWAIDKARQQPSGFVMSASSRPALTTGELLLRAPNERVLTTTPPLTIAAGERYLVRGPSGTGKSTLLRALAGLWPYGSGQINLPAGQMMFLPQRSYIPTGSLKQAICYPGDPTGFTDEACRKALSDCGLQQRVGSLTEVDRWQQKLSGGEQQRLAFARVLLHKPLFVFLDEATSAMDPESERGLYAALIEQLPGSAVVSVAHRESLAQFHGTCIELAPATPSDTPG